ncbi:MAG TPA: Gfo/Idh/MocA family oxidoreductase [Acidobacteriaceae bacterium]
MSKPVRVGIVGARFAARFHWEGLRRVYGVPVEIVGVTSQSAEVRDTFARERGLHIFENIEALCEAVDVVDLCTPPATHEKLAVFALQRGRHVIIEKPLTGYFGDSSENFNGASFSKGAMLQEATDSCTRILEAAKKHNRYVCYAENWIYAPAVQKQREIVAKSGGQILWMIGEESHSGSHSAYYGIWKFSGGGSMMGKGCHPLSAALYLKRVEGEARHQAAIRPATVSARTHAITRLPQYQDAGLLRTSYQDVEDYAQMHVTFSDGMVADLFASELVLGGVHNWLEVIANNHRSRCNLSPTNGLETFSPKAETLKDIYIMEKIGSTQGWMQPATDEAWHHGYPQEFQDFMESIYHDRPPLSGIELARDTIATIYAGYLSAERGGAEVEVPL